MFFNGFKMELESFKKDMDYCKRMKSTLCTRVDKMEDTLGNNAFTLGSIDTRLNELEKFKKTTNDDLQRDRELYSYSVSELKKQIADLQISVTEKLMAQEKQYSEQTTAMIETHDAKTHKLFEKIEDRTDRNAQESVKELNKINEKIDLLTKNQWKFMGAMTVIVLMVTLISPFILDTMSKKDDKKNDLLETIKLIKALKEME